MYNETCRKIRKGGALDFYADYAGPWTPPELSPESCRVQLPVLRDARVSPARFLRNLVCFPLAFHGLKLYGFTALPANA